jgi:hypothetical protein
LTDVLSAEQNSLTLIQEIETLLSPEQIGKFYMDGELKNKRMLFERPLCTLEGQLKVSAQ